MLPAQLERPQHIALPVHEIYKFFIVTAERNFGKQDFERG